MLSQTCGCKGIRYCKLCEHTHRVTTLRADSLPVPVQHYELFCVCCNTSISCPHFPDREEHAAGDLRGVSVTLDFITEEEEARLVKEMDLEEWAPSQSGRLKQDYGPRANYKRRKLKLDRFEGLPKYSLCIRNRLSEIALLQDFKPVEQCNLEYKPEWGSSIDFHFDDFWLWGERLIILNLLSDSFMLFNRDDRYVKVPLPRRSLIIMSGDGRYEWKHAIAREDIQARRISVTFRELSPEFLSGDRAEEGHRIIEIASNLV